MINIFAGCGMLGMLKRAWKYAQLGRVGRLIRIRMLIHLKKWEGKLKTLNNVSMYIYTIGEPYLFSCD